MSEPQAAGRDRVRRGVGRRGRQAAAQPRQPPEPALRPVPDARRVLLRRSGRLPRGLPVASAPRLRDRHLHARRPHATRGHVRQPRRPRARRRAVDDRRPRHHPLGDAAADGRAHARLPAVDQPAGAREDEARGVSRHSRRARSRPWRSTGAGSCGSSPGHSASRASRRRGRSAACRPSRSITTCGCRRPGPP